VSDELQAHLGRISNAHMRELFASDPARAERFSLQVGDLLLDYSKNRITDETLALLLQLAQEADVAGWRDRMFGGEKINNTEIARYCTSRCATAAIVRWWSTART
jgi:glucose-6-phosphate isomerase